MRSGRGNLLISSEGLVHRDIAAFAASLLSHLGPEDGWEPIVLCTYTCRDHFDRMASLYNQEVEYPVAMETCRPDDYLRCRAPAMSYVSELRQLQRSGLPLRVLNYHPHEDSVRRLLASVGFQEASIILNVRRNVSLSVPGLIATRAANAVAKSSEERQRLFAALRKKVRPFFATSGAIFSPEAMADAEVYFRQDRENLAPAYDVQLAPPGLTGMQDRFFISRNQ